MDELIAELQALIDTPDDLSRLPHAIARAQELKKTHTEQEGQYQDRIMKLQEYNKGLLAQIPVAGATPDPQGDPDVTFEDAQAQLINAMQNIGGN